MPRPSGIALLVIVLLGGLAPGGCAVAPPQSRFPDITFQHLAPIKLDVREVAVEQAYRPPSEAPNVDHLFAVRPADAAVRWARDRLRAAGPTRRARYVVREASVVETSIKTSSGLKGAVTIEQSERYNARIVVEIQIIADDGRTEGTATVRAERSITVAENVTLHEREQVWFKMTEDIMRDLNGQLEQTIKTVFFRYLVP